MDILSFSDLVIGEFVFRPNRFVAIVNVNGEERKVHVHDPGRLTELLRPGAPVLLLPKKGAKTDFHLIAVHRERYGWIFTHSGYHSPIVQKLIESRALPEFKDVVAYGKEIKIDNHRIDFVVSYPNTDVLLEVKGCTLFQNDLALFPDAPTKRGREHVDLLAGYGDSILLFLVMGDRLDYFAPNAETDPDFYNSFLNALSEGVHVIPATFSFDCKTLRHVGRVPFISDPHDEELLSLASVAARSAKEYNKRFSPEAHSIFSGVFRIDGVSYVHLVFHGIFCKSCGVYDYLDDYGEILEDAGVSSALESVNRFGNAFVVRYRVRSSE